MSPSTLLKIFKGPEAIDRILVPIHNMSFLLLFLATLSIQPVVTEVLGPLKDILACFLITFPFTAGLTILFLIILNLNWDKVTGASVISAIMLLTLFFWMLIFISHKLDLEKRGKEIRKNQILGKIGRLNKELEEEQGVSLSGRPATDSGIKEISNRQFKDSGGHPRPPAGWDAAMQYDSSTGKSLTHLDVDSILSIRVVNGDGTINDSALRSGNGSRERFDRGSIERVNIYLLLDSLQNTANKLKEILVLSKGHPETRANLQRQTDEISKLRFDITRPDPWYLRINTIGPFITTLVYFKIVLGTGGFFSAILLAAFFAFYIQRLGALVSRKRHTEKNGKIS